MPRALPRAPRASHPPVHRRGPLGSVLVLLLLVGSVLAPLAPAFVPPAHANLPARPVDHPGDPGSEPPLEIGDPDNGQDLVSEWVVVMVAGQPFVFRVPPALAHVLRRIHSHAPFVHDRSANRR
jgi:hypothetical protein